MLLYKLCKTFHKRKDLSAVLTQEIESIFPSSIGNKYSNLGPSKTNDKQNQNDLVCKKTGKISFYQCKEADFLVTHIDILLNT